MVEVFYGTYIPLQGIDVIAAAAERLRSNPRIRFTLIGEGQEFPRIRALVERAGLSNVTFVGMLAPEALAEREFSLEAQTERMRELLTFCDKHSNP